MSIFVSTLVWQADLPFAEQHVLLALADHAWDDGSHVYPSIDYTAWKTNLTDRAVQLNMRRLEARGILVAVANLQGGRKRPTIYRIDLDAIPLKEKYGPIEEYRKGESASPIRTQKGESDDRKGESDDRKGESDDRKGESRSPETSLTIRNESSRETSARARASFTNLKQKTENAEAERPRSMPTTGLAPRLPEVTPLPDPTPPIAPAPPAPPPGVEVPVIWMQVYTLAAHEFGVAAANQWLGLCRLYRVGPGAYVLTCRKPLQWEQLTTRFFNQLKMDLAACAREPMESFEVRLAA